jgi:hypothetical protein
MPGIMISENSQYLAISAKAVAMKKVFKIAFSLASAIF